MKRLFTSLFFLILIAAACGDATTEVGTGSPDDTPAATDPDGDSTVGQAGEDVPIPVESDGGIGDGAGRLPDELPFDEVLDEQVVTDDEPVDGKVMTPSEVVVNPEDDTEVWVRFVGGDVNCTAAYVTVLTETPDTVNVELVVGITSDALVKSCLAGEFNLRVEVSLSESVVGKSIFWTVADTGDEAPLVTPDLSTDDFIGLSEDEAAAIADENILTWRVTRIDDDWFAVTEDYNPGRLNFEIDDDKISVVTLG
jgi:hypothetical protein